MPDMFIRKIKFKFKDRQITFPGLDIEFEIKFSQDEEGNAGHIRFFNLSDSTIEQLKQDEQFILEAGYKNDTGIILPGIIERQQTKWDKVDKVTTLIVGDNTKAYLNSTINQTWQTGAKASEIAPKIAKATGLQVVEINLAEDVTYEKGKTFSTTCQKALKEIAKDTNSKLYCNKGKIYMRPKEKHSQQTILLNSDTGLISAPQKNSNSDEKGTTFTIQSLLNYRIQVDTLVKVESKTVSGEFRVVSGKHTAEGKDYTTTAEVKRIE